MVRGGIHVLTDHSFMRFIHTVLTLEILCDIPLSSIILSTKFLPISGLVFDCFIFSIS